MSRSAIGSYWTGALSEDARERSTLEYCNVNMLEIGKTHPVWNTVSSCTTDVKKGITKARLVTGTYILQSNRAKFNKYEVDSTCPLCRIESEDRAHMLTRCPALSCVRTDLLHQIRLTIINNCGPDTWSRLTSRPQLTALLIDCTALAENGLLPENPEMMKSIESLSRRLCHRLHVKRIQELRKLNLWILSNTRIDGRPLTSPSALNILWLVSTRVHTFLFLFFGLTN